jgi:hypothetical protein
MIRTVGGMLLLALMPALQSQDKAGKAATPAEQYKTILADYEKAAADFRKALDNAKTPEEQQKVFQEKDPEKKRDAFAARFLELAEKNPTDPVAVDALVWVATNTPSNGLAPDNPHFKALSILTRDHIQSDKLGPLVERLPYDLDEGSQKFLRAVAEKNPSRNIRGKAYLVLAQQAENRLQVAHEFKDNPDLAKSYESNFRKKMVEELVKADLDKLNKEAQARYERLAKDYSDLSAGQVGTMKRLAEIKLEALRHPIVIGKPAPEIEGEGIDGKKFKLSDYRGKVVLLDFWGNW